MRSCMFTVGHTLVRPCCTSLGGCSNQVVHVHCGAHPRQAMLSVILHMFTVFSVFTLVLAAGN